MALNEEYDFNDVRYLISSKAGVLMPAGGTDEKALGKKQQISYEVGLSFLSRPDKKLFEPGTRLVRLDFPVNFALFMAVWWMRREIMDLMLRSSDVGAAALRREWQNLAAMPKPNKGIRTCIYEIVLTRPAYAWVGIASARFHKSSGAEQIFLPNLARGAGPGRSDHARLLASYTVPAI